MSFSVLMSVYNKESPRYLRECLLSLAGQDLPANELVLVEDGPISSELSDVIESFRCELNIVSVKLESNVGLGLALNQGLQACRYNLVARMDTDDIAFPCRFEKQISFMERNPDISVLSGCIEEWDENMINKLSKRNLPLTHQEIYRFAKTRSPISHPACVFIKSDVISAGCYPDIYPEDYQLWITMIQNDCKFANLPDVMLKMRTGKQFITRRGYKFLKGELKIYRYMYKTGFINTFKYLKIVFLRSLLRLSPSFVKLFLYKYAR